MWKWLDPIECRIAQQCLAHGQTLEAAKHLLAGSHREHRAVRDLLLRIGPELVEQARQSLAAGDALVAGQLIDCAAQCGELPPAARALQAEIARICERQQQDQHWRRNRLQTAEQWARQGRLQSAIGLVEPLAGDDPPRLGTNWTGPPTPRGWTAMSASSTTIWPRTIRRGRSGAAQGPRGGARSAPGAVHERVAGPARPAVASSPVRVDDMAVPDAAPATPTATSTFSWSLEQPDDINRNAVGNAAIPARLLLTGLPSHGPVLIIRDSVVLVGTTKDPDVQLPLQAMLHRRHALLIREKSRDGNSPFRVAPLTGCAVSVNGARIPEGQTRTLTDGDIIQFGNEHCRWTFRQPETEIGSETGAYPRFVSSFQSTALLQQTRPASACAVAPDGTQVRCVVLAGDELIIGRDRAAAHLVEPGLPARQLRLAWQADGLYAHAASAACHSSTAPRPTLPRASRWDYPPSWRCTPTATGWSAKRCWAPAACTK
jgi:hypothetical protein